eukprot:45254-Rhodomonas_salina.1
MFDAPRSTFDAHSSTLVDVRRSPLDARCRSTSKAIAANCVLLFVKSKSVQGLHVTRSHNLMESRCACQ